MVQTDKEKEKEQQPETEDVSEGYVLSMGVPRKTLHLLDFRPEPGFIIAVHPGIHEDDIWAAGVPLTMQAPAGGKRAQVGNVMVTGNISAAKGFVAKCVYQIVDYSIPVQELDGRKRTRRWDSGNKGDNDANREVYAQLLQAPFRDIIEGFLDMMAGRDTETQHDFEELKNVQPQLLSTS